MKRASLGAALVIAGIVVGISGTWFCYRFFPYYRSSEQCFNEELKQGANASAAGSFCDSMFPARRAALAKQADYPVTNAQGGLDDGLVPVADPENYAPPIGP